MYREASFHVEFGGIWRCWWMGWMGGSKLYMSRIYIIEINITMKSSLFTDIYRVDDIGKETRRILLKYTLTTIVFLFAASLLLNIVVNTGTAEYNLQKYFFVYALPIFFVFGIVLSLQKDVESSKFFLKLMSLTAVFVAFLYYYIHYIGSIDTILLSNYALSATIVVFGLAILYQGLIAYMEKLQGWPGFIAQLLFFLPCIVYDVWDYLIEQINLTPYSIYLFIALEIVLVLAYILLPSLSDKVTGRDNALALLEDVAVLNKRKTVATSDVLKDDDKNYNRNYALSFWMYVVPHPPNHEAYTKESEILSYGYQDQKGVEHVKPMIRYYGGGGGDDQTIERNKLVFYFAKYPPTQQYASDEHTFYDITLPLQKWNQIALNYNRNQVEIYMNGTLERTFELKNNMPRYDDLDTITIGQDNGIQGGICNVAYFRHPLSPEQISLSYNATILSDLPLPRKT